MRIPKLAVWIAVHGMCAAGLLMLWIESRRDVSNRASERGVSEHGMVEDVSLPAYK